MPSPRYRFGLPAIAAVAIAALVTAVSAGASSPQAHAQRLPVLATGYQQARVRPTTIGYTGDGSGIIGKLPSNSFHHVVGQRPGFLHWTVWTDTHAAATGTVWLLSCRPSCAASPFYRYALTLTAGRVRNGHFTRMTLHYRYQGQPVSDTRCVPDGRPALIWGLVFNGRCES
ncbi:MAG: hypothetical protein JO304_20490 [Solirubrobacterales bacterium]|jgi:hypothetical protein|nr:hypothetical protein [Solirubrobacterales bacterium]